MSKILSIAPSRISLFGGGSDIPTYYEQNGGLVLNFAINIRTYTTLYTEDDIWVENKFPHKAKPEFYYRILEEFNLGSMHHAKLLSDYEGIIESGLGSSASAAVALIGAINKSEKLNLTRDEIAEKAWEIEIKQGIYGGKQDQYASVYGGINVIEFGSKVKVTQLSQEFLKDIYPSLLLFHTGKHKKTSQNVFKGLTDEQIKNIDMLKATVIGAIDYITKGDVEAIGNLLDKTWEFKKKINTISNPEIDSIYKKGKELGALGGKLLGSGGGGYMLFVVPPKKQEQFIRKIGIEHWDFNIDTQGLDVRAL